MYHLIHPDTSLLLKITADKWSAVYGLFITERLTKGR